MGYAHRVGGRSAAGVVRPRAGQTTARSGAHAHHRDTPVAVAGEPARATVYVVNDVGGTITQDQVFAVVTQSASVYLVGGHAGHSVVIGALQEKVASCGDRAVQDDRGVGIRGGKGPTGQVDGTAGGVVQLNPLVVGRGGGPHPGDLTDHHVQRCCLWCG
jgi:hypothetical protein